MKAGAEFRPGGPWRATGEAGFKRRGFDGPVLHPFSGGVGAASLDWSPGAKTDVTAKLAADALESVVEPASGYFREYSGRLPPPTASAPADLVFLDADGAADLRERRPPPGFRGAPAGRRLFREAQASYMVFENMSFWIDGEAGTADVQRPFPVLPGRDGHGGREACDRLPARHRRKNPERRREDDAMKMKRLFFGALFLAAWSLSAEEEYRVGVEDMLDVRVMDQQDLNGSYTVAP